VGKVYTDDIGTLIKLDTGEALAGATGCKIIARPPKGGAIELAATVVEGTKLQHVKSATTLREVGIWQLQAYVKFGEEEYCGEIVGLQIYKVLS